MAAVHVDLHIEQGSDWPGLAFPLFDEEGQTYDTTGCTARGQIRRSPSTLPVLFTWSTSPGAGEGLLTLVSGLLTVRVLGSESDVWDWRTAVYDIELNNPAAPVGKQKFRVAQGAVLLDLEVTR